MALSRVYGPYTLLGYGGVGPFAQIMVQFILEDLAQSPVTIVHVLTYTDND